MKQPSRRPGEITSAGVFCLSPPPPSYYGNQSSDPTGRIKTNARLTSKMNTDDGGRQTFNIHLICAGREGLMIREADVHVFRVLALLRAPCLVLKRQQTTARKPKQDIFHPIAVVS